jgi:hypothetical protein
MSSRAFAIEPSPLSLNDAERFGRVSYIFDDDNSRPSIWNNAKLRTAVLAALQKFSYNPEQDYLILTGQVVLLSFIVAIIANEYGPFKALVFDAPNRAYQERVFG